MKTSISLFTFLVSIFLIFTVSAQENSDWTLPRTSAGHPDLQGLWENPTITPFERPDDLAGKVTLTTEEAEAIELANAKRIEESEAKPMENWRGYNNFWLDRGTTVLSTKQTSLVVDPPNGKMPVRPEAEAQRDYNTTHNGDHYRFMSVWDRCITRGVPGSMFPAGYNNAYRIIQTENLITIVYEMIHDVRIIPIVDKKEDVQHIDKKIKLWMGDSRAWWEGDTLVIETTNYNDRGWIASSLAGGNAKGIAVTEDLHVVERFKRVSEDTIMWAVTITDPEIYTQAWTVSMPLSANPDYVMFEYACHEGNQAVKNGLSGARYIDGTLNSP